MSKQRPDRIEQAIRFGVVTPCLAALATLAAAAVVVAVVNAPTRWQGAVIASNAAVAVTAAMLARRGPEAAMRGLLGKVAKWDLADTRADLDVVGPITGDTKAVAAPLYDFDDEGTIPGRLDAEAEAGCVMKKLIFYGASDDLAEVEGDHDGEYYIIGGRGTFRLEGHGATGVRVHLVYEDSGCWSVGVSPLGEDTPVPDSWTFTVQPRGIEGGYPRYSAVLTAGVDDDVVVTWEGEA